jgi:predicted MFS family arabinose efflux permease
MAKDNILTSDFILVCAAQFTISFVISILVPTIPIYLASFNAREAEIGVLVGSLSVSSLFLRPLVGKALLRIPERRFMITGSSLYVIASLAYLWAPPFWPLLAARLLQGMGLALFATACFTLVANIVPPSHRGQMISYFYLANNVAFALAPYVGILVLNRFGFRVVFLICTALSLAALFISLRLKEAQPLPAQDPLAKKQPLLSHEALPPATMALLVNIIWGAITAFFPLFAVSKGVTNPGIFFTVFALMLILGRGFGGKILDLYDRKKVLFPSLTVYIIAMVILSFSSTLPMFTLVAILWGAGNAFVFPSLLIDALERAGTSPGPAMGTFTALADLGTGVGPMIMGIILQNSSYPTMFLCLALTGVINFSYLYYLTRKQGGGRNADLRISL